MSYLHDFHSQSELINAAEHTSEASLDNHALSLDPPTLQLRAVDNGSGHQDQSNEQNSDAESKEKTTKENQDPIEKSVQSPFLFASPVKLVSNSENKAESIPAMQQKIDMDQEKDSGSQEMFPDQIGEKLFAQDVQLNADKNYTNDKSSEPVQQQKSTIQRQKIAHDSNPSGFINTLPIQRQENKTGLPDEVKGKMEATLNSDFSDVNIQTNSDSATKAGALAYTQGNDVHFAPGQFKPDTRSGQELIGHELTHVVQQRESSIPATTSAGGMPVNDDPVLEREADRMGSKAASADTGSAQFKINPNQNIDHSSAVQLRKADAQFGEVYSSSNYIHSTSGGPASDFSENQNSAISSANAKELSPTIQRKDGIRAGPANTRGPPHQLSVHDPGPMACGKGAVQAKTQEEIQHSELESKNADSVLDYSASNEADTVQLQTDSGIPEQSMPDISSTIQTTHINAGSPAPTHQTVQLKSNSEFEQENLDIETRMSGKSYCEDGENPPSDESNPAAGMTQLKKNTTPIQKYPLLIKSCQLSFNQQSSINQHKEDVSQQKVLQRECADRSNYTLSNARFSGNRNLQRIVNCQISQLSSRQNGSAVRAVQQALLALGFTLIRHSTDGLFGSETSASITQFREQNGLGAGGLDARALHELDTRAPPPGQSQQHELNYDRMLEDGQLDITIGIGYYDQHTDILIDAVHGWLDRHSFIPADEENHYRKEHPFSDRTTQTSRLYTVNVHVILPEQPGAANAFLQGMNNSDVATYIGHARGGTGPDFDAKNNPTENLVIGRDSAGHQSGQYRGPNRHSRGVAVDGTNDLEQVRDSGFWDTNRYRVWFFNACSSVDYLDEIRGGLLPARMNRSNLDVFGTRKPPSGAGFINAQLAFLDGILNADTVEEIRAAMNRSHNTGARRLGRRTERRHRDPYFAEGHSDNQVAQPKWAMNDNNIKGTRTNVPSGSGSPSTIQKSEPKIRRGSTTIEHSENDYDISGTYRNVSQNIAARDEAGSIATNISDYSHQSSRDGSRITISITVSIVKSMPNWTDIPTIRNLSSDSSQSQQKRDYYSRIISVWETFMASLDAHEERHKSIDVAGYTNIHRHLIGKTLNEADARLDELEAAIQTQHEEFHDDHDASDIEDLPDIQRPYERRPENDQDRDEDQVQFKLKNQVNETGRAVQMKSHVVQRECDDGQTYTLTNTRFSGNRILRRIINCDIEQLSSAHNGTAVSLVQNALLALGYTLIRYGEDGSYGNETSESINLFRLASNLGAGGLDAEALQALDRRAPAAGVSESHELDYGRLLEDNQLDITVAMGYDEGQNHVWIIESVHEWLRNRGFQNVDMQSSTHEHFRKVHGFEQSKKTSLDSARSQFDQKN